jgi:hypothetical protein
MGRLQIRFDPNEDELIEGYCARHFITNKSGFIKDHFWRSFMQYQDDGVNENVKAIRDLAKQIEKTSRINLELLKLLSTQLLDESTKEQLTRILDGNT